MQIGGNVDRLTLEHFKELQGAWARERTERERLAALSSEQQDQISALKLDISILESAIHVETLRYALIFVF
jgi:hypothetical protein